MTTKHQQLTKHKIVVVPTRPRYAQGIVEVERIHYRYDEIFERECEDCFTIEKVHSQIKHFSEGQYTAIDLTAKRIVGLTASMRIAFDPANPRLKSWADETNNAWLDTHNPTGEWLYGVESCVLPEYRSLGIGSVLIRARFDVVRRLNLRGMIAGSVIIDYHKVADSVSVENYLEDVIAGRRFDTNLSKQMKKGFKPLFIIPNYVEEPDSLNYGVAIIRENPDYTPGKYIRSVRPKRYRVDVHSRRKRRV